MTGYIHKIITSVLLNKGSWVILLPDGLRKCNLNKTLR